MYRPILTLWAMYKYDATMFDKMLIPDTLDKESLLGYFFMYAGNNECRYGDPEELKALIEMWSRARNPEWKRMCDALQAEYNPIENYDRMEEHLEIIENRRNSTLRQESSSNGDSTSENTVSAFDSNEYQPKNKIKENTKSSVNSNGENTENIENNRKNDIRAHGNIGVTTSQQMIESELDLRMYNIYKTIAMEFENEFTIPVYERRCYNGML